jgi:hypothetical protein
MAALPREWRRNERLKGSPRTLRAIYAHCLFPGLFTRIRHTLNRIAAVSERAAAQQRSKQAVMISPLEIMPVLALALAIVFIPLLSDGPPSL